MNRLPRSARIYIGVITAIGAAVAMLVFALYPIPRSAELLLLMTLTLMVATQVIKIGDRVYLTAAHPFLFAALILGGPSGALVTAATNILAAAVFKKDRMRQYQVQFNLSVAAICIGASWATYACALPAGGATEFHEAAFPILLASLVFYVLNGWLVAVAMGLGSTTPIWRTWLEHVMWSGPSFLVGGGIGLAIARSLEGNRAINLILLLPFCYLIYSSYRLYMDRMDEKKARLKSVERLNEELGSKVRELANLNEHLQESNLRIAEASKVKSEFLANVSHELRTPLNAIIGFSDVLKRHAARDARTRDGDLLDQIHRSGKDLLALINDILDLSKIEAGRMEVRFEDCSPARVVTEALSMVQVLASRKKVKLVREPGEDPGQIPADPLRLRQILWNLLSNAIKFTPAGGVVRVEVALEGQWVRIAVVDTGIGIAARDLDRIFIGFFQVDGGLARQQGGTGLGLTLVKKFIDLHDGRIQVTSELQQGSRFEVFLPVCRFDRGLVPAGGTVSAKGVAPDSSAAAVADALTPPPVLQEV